MRRVRKLVFISCASLLAAALTMHGCSSAGYKKAAQTTTRINDLRKNLVDAQQQVDRTVDALNALNTQTTGNLVPTYKAYAKQVGRMESAANKVRKEAESMRSSKDAYIKSWEKELNSLSDPALRKQALARQSELSDRFEKLRDTMQAANQSFEPFLNDLKNARTYLGNDLTPAGVQHVAQTMTQVDQDAATVKEKIDPVIAELDELAQILSPKAG